MSHSVAYILQSPEIIVTKIPPGGAGSTAIRRSSMTFIFTVHLSFYAIPLLNYGVMYDITTTP